MGLIICDNNEVLHPFYIPELHLNIYSYEELCYIIYEHPVLVQDHFISSKLLDFIDLELGLTSLRSRLAKMNQDKVAEDDKLVYILGFGNVYSHQEIARFKKLLDRFRKVHKAEYLMLRANYMFELGLYGRAATDYNRILRFGRDKYVTTKFIASVYENLGSAYANLFMYERAFHAYKNAYEVLKDTDILRRMYQITLIEPGIVLGEELENTLDEKTKIRWDEEFEKVLERASNSNKVYEIKKIYQGSEASQKAKAKEMIGEWRRAYRAMV